MHRQQFLSHNQKNLVGIYGGVGPLAHIEFEKMLLEQNYMRGARSDQDHPVWLVANATSTPDRTKTLLSKTFESKKTMIHYAKLLEQMGAQALMVICNTAHGYHKIVQRELSIPWIHLMNITANYVKKTYPDIQTVGILGTDATIQLHLYHDALTQYSLTPVAPQIDSSVQQGVMDAIYHKEFGIKATGAHVEPIAVKNLVIGAKWCMENGAEAVIAGCTEISVGLTEKIFPFIPIIDPLTVAANIFLDISYGHRKPEEFVINY